MANGNGNGVWLKVTLTLITVLSGLSAWYSHWTLQNIFEIRETVAVHEVRIKFVEDTRFTEADGVKLDGRIKALEASK